MCRGLYACVYLCSRLCLCEYRFVFKMSIIVVEMAGVLLLVCIQVYAQMTTCVRACDALVLQSMQTHSLQVYYPF